MTILRTKCGRAGLVFLSHEPLYKGQKTSYENQEPRFFDAKVFKVKAKALDCLIEIKSGVCIQAPVNLISI